jgi:hypothetical protein
MNSVMILAASGTSILIPGGAWETWVEEEKKYDQK